MLRLPNKLSTSAIHANVLLIEGTFRESVYSIIMLEALKSPSNGGDCTFKVVDEKPSTTGIPPSLITSNVALIASFLICQQSFNNREFRNHNSCVHFTLSISPANFFLSKLELIALKSARSLKNSAKHR